MPAALCLTRVPTRPFRAPAALALLGLTATAAMGQLSGSSWWPKFQHDARNSGSAAVMGIVRQAHVSWTVRIGDPIDPEHHSSPVFSEDDRRLYVGGDGSMLTAVDIGSGQVAWTVTLGDGSGIIHQTPTIAEGGAIYVGAWDLSAPYDGFSKVLDEGPSGRVVWTYPMERVLASATITPDALIIVCGRHATLGWGVFALRDLGETFEEVWTVETGRNGAIGATPAVSQDKKLALADERSSKAAKERPPKQCACSVQSSRLPSTASFAPITRPMASRPSKHERWNGFCLRRNLPVLETLWHQPRKKAPTRLP